MSRPFLERGAQDRWENGGTHRVPGERVEYRPAPRALATLLRAGLLAVVLGLATASCALRLGGRADAPPEATSLFGEPLRSTPATGAARESLEARLAVARKSHDAAPGNADATIWLGRRTAYLGRYREAIDIFSAGLKLHAGDARLYRHRGHRYLTVRAFDRAIADFEMAVRLIAGTPDEIEPDGLPNARNQPTSTLHSNIWYHLALAHYLAGRFAPALACWQQSAATADNVDHRVATTYWMHLCLLKLGRAADAREALAPIHADLDVIENQAYHRLLLVYRGEARADTLWESARARGGTEAATVGYGLAAWRLSRGEREAGLAGLRETLAIGVWAAFGSIAAEADLHRVGERP